MGLLISVLVVLPLSTGSSLLVVAVAVALGEVELVVPLWVKMASLLL